MGGIDGDGGQQRIDFALKVALGKDAGFLAELVPLEQADALLAQLGEQLLVPAAVLGGDKGVNVGGEDGEGLVGAEAVETGLAVAVLNALHEPGLAHLDVFVEVVAGDGEELYALEQGVGGVFGFLKHTPVELHPGVVASVKKLLFVCSSGHSCVQCADKAVYSFLAGDCIPGRNNRRKIFCQAMHIVLMWESVLTGGKKRGSGAGQVRHGNDQISINSGFSNCGGRKSVSGPANARAAQSFSIELTMMDARRAFTWDARSFLRSLEFRS